MEYNITFRLKNGGWQYIISYKVNPNEKWKQKAKQGFTTKKEAKVAAEIRLADLKIQMKNNNFNPKSNSITFKEVADLFIKHNELYKQTGTIITYETAITGFKELYNVEVKNIKLMNIQECVDSMVKGGIKSTTLKTYLSKIKLILDFFKDNYDENYKIDLNKIILPKQQIDEKKALTKIELDNVLMKMKDINYQFYIVCLIAGTCGLRIGEILGLTWDDVGLKELNVNKQWKLINHSEYGFGTLKNNKARKVPLPISTRKELMLFKNSSPITDISNRIITYNASYTRYRIDGILKDIAGITIHNLRHTYATLLVASNKMDFKTIAYILGHTVEQTLRTYSHVTNDMYKNAQKEIENIF